MISESQQSGWRAIAREHTETQGHNAPLSHDGTWFKIQSWTSLQWNDLCKPPPKHLPFNSAAPQISRDHGKFVHCGSSVFARQPCDSAQPFLCDPQTLSFKFQEVKKWAHLFSAAVPMHRVSQHVQSTIAQHHQRRKMSPETISSTARAVREHFTAKAMTPETVAQASQLFSAREAPLSRKTQCFVQILTFKSHIVLTRLEDLLRHVPLRLNDLLRHLPTGLKDLLKHMPTGLNDLLRHMPTGLNDLLRHMPTGLNDLLRHMPTGLNDLLRHMPTGLNDLLSHMPTGLNDLWATRNVKVRNSEFLYETSFDYMIYIFCYTLYLLYSMACIISFILYLVY